ncbi:hypothetical protein [Flavobacterium caeni]|uniref:Uncharacterized protein n=1 Tax=Flavobacterium caeni TaxID=490189 RepID=A0A1G5BNZ7_9FLAO|nr:hypothetical protein [Flavobacterium caeni]SCX91925.1 hypothetical protein SAMN02927903_00437 [Flavobacterium caeni]
MERKITGFLLLWSALAVAQVGINTPNPDPSASLDIRSADTGLLIPRVALVSVTDATTPIQTPQRSLLVYNTNNIVTGGSGEGYYYWDGAAWVKLLTDDEKLWQRNAAGQMFPNRLADRVGINTNTPNAPLQFSNTVENRKIVLHEVTNNDHQFYGLGVNPNTLRYQTATTADDHAFFAGNGSSTSREIMRMRGSGNVGIGTATPAYRLDVSGSGGIDINFRTTGRLWSDSPYGGLFTGNDSFVGNFNTTHFGIWTSGAGNAFTILKANGNVGINNDNPTQKLDVVGKIRIADGTQAPGRILSTDANGVASWVNSTSITPAVSGAFGANGLTFGNGVGPGGTTPYYYCGAYIDLPPGKWMVFGTFLINGFLAADASVIVRTSLSCSDTNYTACNTIMGALISGILSGPNEFGIATGQSVILNNTAGVRRYYLWASLTKYGSTPAAFTVNNLASNVWGENQLTAIPMN